MGSAPWKDLPDRYPPHRTCRRRFRQWARAGVFRRVPEEPAADLQERGGTDIREAFIDGSFVPAKKGAVRSAGQSAAKGAGSWQLRTLPVFLSPYALQVLSPHEVKLTETALNGLLISAMPEKLIGDKAYDSDGPDAELLKKHGIEMTAPHRRSRTETKTQDGRKLRRYKRRRKVGRLFARLQNFRRPVVRYERHADNFSAFLLPACSIILIRFF